MKKRNISKKVLRLFLRGLLEKCTKFKLNKEWQTFLCVIKKRMDFLLRMNTIKS
jgi:hypothetical protein